MKTVVSFGVMTLFEAVVAMLTLQNLVGMSNEGRPGFNSTLSHLELVDPVGGVIFIGFCSFALEFTKKLFRELQDRFLSYRSLVVGVRSNNEFS